MQGGIEVADGIKFADQLTFQKSISDHLDGPNAIRNVLNGWKREAQKRSQCCGVKRTPVSLAGFECEGGDHEPGNAGSV